MQRVEKTVQLLQERIVCEQIPIDGIYIKECLYKTGSNLPLFDASWRKFANGSTWGEYRDTHCWFYVKVDVPAQLKEETVRLSVKTDKTGWDAENPQFLAYIDGECVQGLDINHTTLRLPNKDHFELYLYAYSGTPDVNGNNHRPASTLDVAFEVIDTETEALYYDVSVPMEIAKYLPIESIEYTTIVNILREACSFISFYDDSYIACIKKARGFLQDNLYHKSWHTDDACIACIGHTHIDIAWLWTVAQAREKAQRSFATEVALLKQNEDFYFTSSQPYLYQAVKEEAPELYKEIRDLVLKGKWEAEGAAWLEFDCNIPCGESLVRQIYYGKKFFKEEFNIDSKILWLPDVFGYSAALPQILKKAGVDKFVTSKISWNDTNRLPNDIFQWKGIDGSEVLAYFISTTPKRRGLPVINGTGYVSVASPAEVAGTYERFEPKNLANELICCYGHGDGGGGVTQAMIEKIRRMQKGLPGCPTTRMKTVTQTFADMEKKNAGKTLPTWTGELYLEFHRGTYTSRALNKKYNRLCEEKLKNAEFLYTLLFVKNRTPYPHEKFERLWKSVLLNQFHDILPGSSIREVYEVTDKEYLMIVSELDDMILSAEDLIAQEVSKNELVLFNTTSTCTCGVAEVQGAQVYFDNIPQKGYKVIKKSSLQNTSTCKTDETFIENKWYRLTFNNAGQVVSLYYKPQNREVLKDGQKGNLLMAYTDIPAEYDAWNLDADYYKNGAEINTLISQETIEEQVRVGKKFLWKYGESFITQTIWLYENLDRIDFQTEVNWQAEHILLKTLFPVDINTNKATFEIQYGSVERSTTENTSWEQAQFEVPAQRYAYKKENGFGFALLNDCKYGYSAKNDTISLSLLRSPAYPYKWADKGMHTFTYSVYCGGEGFEQEVVNHAECLNKPFGVTLGKGDVSTQNCYSLVTCDSANIIIDAVKVAENNKGIILRLYESLNKRTDCILDFGFNVKGVWIADLLENPIERVAFKNNQVSLKVNSFEIITLLIEV